MRIRCIGCVVVAAAMLWGCINPVQIGRFDTEVEAGEGQNLTCQIICRDADGMVAPQGFANFDNFSDLASATQACEENVSEFDFACSSGTTPDSCSCFEEE